MPGYHKAEDWLDWLENHGFRVEERPMFRIRYLLVTGEQKMSEPIDSDEERCGRIANEMQRDPRVVYTELCPVSRAEQPEPRP